VTTENNHPENSDVQVSVAEQSPVSETPATPSPPEVAESTEGQDAQTQTQTPGSIQVEQAEGNGLVSGAGDQGLEHHATAIDTAGINETAPVTPAAQIMADEMFAFSYPDKAALMDEGVVRPFTDFIEEFRQTEGSHGSLQQEPAAETFSSFPPTAEPGTNEPISPGEPLINTIENATGSSPLEEEQQVPAQEREQEQAPATHKERPVSPLLRPATRVRLPRHGSGRQRENQTARPSNPSAKSDRREQGERDESEATQVSQAAELAGTTEPVVAGESSAASIPQVEPSPTDVSLEEQSQPKPARRYRFDRPAPTSPVTPTQPVQQSRTEESKENRVTTFTPARSDNGQPVEREAQPAQPAKQHGNATQYTEEQASKHTPTQEHGATNGGGTSAATPTSTSTTRGRRHSQERQHEKEKAQPPVTSPAPADTASVAEVVEAAASAAQEVPPEDLPPLEYSELQAATSRRRRRRRSSPASWTSAATTSTTPATAKPAASEQPSAGSTTPPSPTPVPASPVALPRNAALPGSPASAGQYNIVSGYTVSQMNQGNDGTGPFMGPEPSPARGSTTTREHRPIRSEGQRAPTYPARHGEPMASPVSIGQLANVISQSFQSQTDRMIAELRRANQVPTNVSVSFPPFPSTERVGVFVDVANLLYSARTQRLTVDFGKLLDFLRGNRRLVRAHAYCPTSPQPGDEQMFLQAVKGLGYRITTKNYKTFSSGAKKADLDLDLCMDVVRLVDGRAVDCVVLVSGDSDFMPMLDYCSDHGVRVEVAAFDESMSATLRQSCDLFINLSMLDEIRA